MLTFDTHSAVNHIWHLHNTPLSAIRALKYSYIVYMGQITWTLHEYFTTQALELPPTICYRNHLKQKHTVTALINFEE